MRNFRIGLTVIVAMFEAGVVLAARAPVPETGQSISYDANTPKRDDGALQVGVKLPIPRFIDNGDGTIKDKLTGLIWLKNADCSGEDRDWQTALSDVASLNTNGKMNGNDCGDTSGRRGSHRTDWRLPNIRELSSLVNFAFFDPAISNTAGTGQGSTSDPFTNLQFVYWSSTTDAHDFPAFAWFVFFDSGATGSAGKINFQFGVLAVRGGP